MSTAKETPTAFWPNPIWDVVALRAIYMADTPAE